jgi:hypothetical protein
VCNFSLIASASSAIEKNLSFLRAASIHVETTPTAPSTDALSLLSAIKDKKHYLQNRIIFKNEGVMPSTLCFYAGIEDNNLG